MQNTGRKVRTTRAELRRNLDAHFSLDELQLLADDLGVDFAGLPGDGKEAKILHFIRHVESKGKAQALLSRCRELRPQAAWGEDIARWDIIKPYALLAAILLVTAGIAFVAYATFVPARMPVGTFNIAVAEFGESGENADGNPSAGGSRLSASVYQRLDGILKTLPDAIKVDRQPLVWFDGLPLWAKRSRIGVIPGSTIDDRRQNAERRSNALNADVLIYGNYRPIQDGETERGELTPEFFIKADSRDADEFTGRQQLGRAIVVPLDPEAASNSQAALQLRARQEALSRIAIALWYDALGSNDKALDVLKQADISLLQSDWPDEEGREVLYYLMGREALLLSSAQADETRARALLDEAMTHFERALQINDSHAASKLAQASAMLQHANWVARQPLTPDDWAGVVTSVTQVITNVAVAQSLKGDEDHTPFHQKAQAILGDAYRLMGVAQTRMGQYTAARDSFDRALGLIETQYNSVDAQQTRFRAQLHLLLGVTHHERARLMKFGYADARASEADFSASAGHYQACINDPSAHDDIYVGRLINLQCRPYLDLLNRDQSR
jgi:tetratricopeptide (TPR) repeat protein